MPRRPCTLSETETAGIFCTISPERHVSYGLVPVSVLNGKQYSSLLRGQPLDRARLALTGPGDVAPDQTEDILGHILDLIPE